MELNRQKTIVLLMEIEELKVVMEKEKERSKVMDEKEKSWMVFFGKPWPVSLKSCTAKHFFACLFVL